MGAPGDLLLIFADALVRSWKQITKFKPAGTPATRELHPPGTDLGEEAAPASAPVPRVPDTQITDFGADALIRDERGVRVAPEVED